MGLWRGNIIRGRRVKKAKPPSIVESLKLSESFWSRSQATKESLVYDERIYFDSQATKESLVFSESITFTNS